MFIDSNFCACLALFKPQSYQRTLANMRRLLREFLHKPVPYETWQSNSGDRRVSNHINALRIPIVNGKPRLLLHDLGMGMVSQQVIDDVFQGSGCVCLPATSDSVLITSPGILSTRPARGKHVFYLRDFYTVGVSTSLLLEDVMSAKYLGRATALGLLTWALCSNAYQRARVLRHVLLHEMNFERIRTLHTN